MAYTKLDYKDLNKWVSENYRFKKDFIDDLWNTVGFMCIHQSDVYDHLAGRKGYSRATAGMYTIFMKMKTHENVFCK